MVTSHASTPYSRRFHLPTSLRVAFIRLVSIIANEYAVLAAAARCGTLVVNSENMNRQNAHRRYFWRGQFASLFDDADDDEEGTYDRQARVMTAITQSSIVANVTASSPCISRASSPAPSETSSAGDSASGLGGEDRARWIRERVSTHLLARDAGLKIDKSTWSDIIENAIVEEVRRLEL